MAARRSLFSAGRPGSRGFSLVEVAMAVGIFAFGFITVFGLIPTGLNSFHKAMDASVSSQIIQQVVTDLQQTDFSTLGTAAQPLRHFDDQGIEATSPTAGPYEVNVVVTMPATLPGGTVSSNLAALTIEIIRNPGHQPLVTDGTGSVQDDPQHGISVSRYSVFLARNDSQVP